MPHSDLTLHRPVSVSRILRKFLLRIKTQLNPNLGDTSAEAGVSVGLLEEVFDKGGGALRCHKVFTSLIVSVAFHLVRFNETIAAKRS